LASAVILSVFTIWTIGLTLPVTAAGSLHLVGNPNISTFSIVAYDPDLREWGVAVQSRFLAVGAAVPFAAAETGAVATQAWGNMSYGPEGLALLAMGVDAQTAVQVLTGKDDQKLFRQLGIVDRNGSPAAYTGSECQAWAGHKTGQNYTVQGNILTGGEVVDAMATAFEQSKGPLADRLLAALSAGQDAGGDSRGRQSAALLIVRRGGGYSGLSDRAVDLRVDDHPTPIKELKRIYDLHLKTFGMLSYLYSVTEFEATGDPEAATACLDRCLVMAESLPDLEPVVLNAVAWSLAEKGRELERALALATRAVKGAPDDANIVDTLATLHFLLGHHDKAIFLEKHAVELSDEPEFFQKKLDHWKNGGTDPGFDALE